MRTLYRIPGAIGVVVVLAGVIGSAGMADSAEAITPQTPAAASGRDAGHQVVVPENVLNPLIGEPERHFRQASSLFTEGDNHGAASEIRAGAALLSLEAGREGGDNASGLQSAAANLDDLAAKVERGDVASRAELNQAFARADLALAKHYRETADKALTNKEHANAGRLLKAAADSLDDAVGWTGQTPSSAQAQAWDQIHALQTKIRNGANWSYGEAKKGIGYLGTQIQYLGQQMQKFGTSPGGSGSSGGP